MSMTFGDVWRRVRLHAPDVPFGLIQDWTLAAYRSLLDRRPWIFSQVWTTLTAAVGVQTLVLPADFGAFLLVLDRPAQRQIPFWFTQDDLFRWDPSNTSTGDPRALVPRDLSTDPLTLNQQTFQWWPTPGTTRTYPALYRQRPVAPADTDPLRGVLADRPDVLETGALMHCALWPGTADRKNPYFSVATYTALQTEFLRLAHQLELRDDDVAQQSFVRLPYHGWAPYNPYDDHGLRTTDAVVTADYFL